ncbi:MAG: Hsp20/alpha crystallin family protein [Thiotrichales bacterium]
MISNMLRFPFSMLDDDFSNWLYPEMARTAGRRMASVAYPPINIGMTDKGVEAYLFVPGMNPDDLNLVIEKNLLSVEGERKLSEEQGEAEGQLRRERFEGKFKRVITLPEDVDPDSAEAVYKDGVLHISIAKRPEAQKRQIKVSVH